MADRRTSPLTIARAPDEPMATDALRTEVRPGWVVPCPHCGVPYRYTVFNIDPTRPFFHESVGADILLRESHDKLVQDMWVDRRPPPDDVLERLWLQLVESAPVAPSGGTFSLWANVHCPACRREIPYNHGVRDLHARLWDDAIVVMDGARVVRDNDVYTVRVDPARDPNPWARDRAERARESVDDVEGGTP